MDYDRFMDKFRMLMKEFGMKNTTQREYIIKTLFLSKKHLDADEITQIIKNEYKSSISRASLYNTLTFLEEIKVVDGLTIEGKTSKVYEINLRVHHDHIICIKCGDITEFHDEKIEELQREVMKKYKFVLQHHNMMLYGICQKCQNKD